MDRRQTNAKRRALDSPHESFLLEVDFFESEDAVDVSLNAEGQSPLTLQSPHRGLRGVQID
ncbi:hypothetical protein TIFTF001_028507 [Ficus carica]|uniref:Uncharacterized protein n=1 Tax=Ficus carica TaxID=3494 RepID=A0AA88DQ10_FICCA|nr:hypothetical protein TIFTF001_028507 [Ficus carica]